MRPTRLALAGGSLALLLILAVVTLSIVRVGSAGISIGVHSYQRQEHELSAFLVLTNTGTVSLTVPLRFTCQVDTVGGSTNYPMDTRYSVLLSPGQHAILSNVLMSVRLPVDTMSWKVNMRMRQMTMRERLVDHLFRTGLMSPRTISKLAGPPKNEADYQWIECGSGLLEVPRHSSEASAVAEDGQNGA
jgi:hypothetical protein